MGDSLAGRAESVELLPLSQGEIRRRDTPEDFVAMILGAAGRPQEIRSTWPESSRVAIRRRSAAPNHVPGGGTTTTPPDLPSMMPESFTRAGMPIRSGI